MADTQDEPRRVIVHIGYGSMQFEFEDFFPAEFFEITGASRLAAEGMSLRANWKANMWKLDEADMPEAYKADMRIIAKQAWVQKFIEMGVPQDLAWPLVHFGESLARSTIEQTTH